MRKAVLSVLSLVLLALANAANAYTVVLQAHNQRSSGGNLSTLIWKTCPGPAPFSAPCINATTPWAVLNGVTGSSAVWDWNPTTQVLSSTGRYEATSHFLSNPEGAPVINDRVIDLVIDLTNVTTSAASYRCIEGTFLAVFGANGCLNTSAGFDSVNASVAVYNVGGAANCIQRTVNGDDSSTGNPRGLQTAAATGGCDAVDGGFGLYTKLSDTTNTTPGGTLRISNGIDILLPNTSYMTFVAVPDAINDGPITVLQDDAKIINVLANDNSFSNPAISNVTIPGKGTATISGTTISYSANVGATGADTFDYTVLDGDGVTSDTATVVVNILPGGANDDFFTTTRNHASIDFNVDDNDSGFGSSRTITITVGPDQGGTATPVEAGPPNDLVIRYTPATTAINTPTYTETFTYEIDDGTVSGTAVVTVTVNNTVPVAGDTGAPGVTISTTGLAPGSVNGTFNAATLAGNSLGNPPSVVTKTDGARGTTTVAGNVVTYTPGAAFYKGTDTFTYTVTDSDPGTAESDTGTVTVTIPDATPALFNGTITTTAGTASAPKALAITLGNGSAAQHPLSVSSQAANGSCALSGTSVTYTPSGSFTGADSCVVRITDEGGAGQSATGTFSITVNARAGGGSGVSLPSSGAVDLWSLALLAGLPLIRRRRRAAV